MAHVRNTGRIPSRDMASKTCCVNCGYQPCRCPWYPEGDKYDIHYDELMELMYEEA